MDLLSLIILVTGLIVLFVGIVLCLLSKEKIKYNKAMQEENDLLLKENHNLEQQRVKEFSKLEQIKNAISLLEERKRQLIQEQEESAQHYFDILDLTYQAKEQEFDQKVKYLKLYYEQQTQEDINCSREAFEHYVENLCKEYIKTEKEFDNQINQLKEILKDCEKELEKIKQTYAAAREAQLREEKINQELDFYSLYLTPAEQSTINLIEELKPRLPEPRVLCMLIWSTFYQKQMNNLCNRVLGPNIICGIYKITNQKTGLCYVGQAVDIAKRWKEHAKCGLGIDTPAQNKLYKAMLKDGLINFTFELLEECERNLLNEKEKFYIDLYQAYTYGYNSNVGINK